MSYLGPDDILSVEYAPGAHPGWDDYWFVCCGIRWRLLVIRKEEEPRSQIMFDKCVSQSAMHQRLVWPEYHHMVLPTCITPETAYEIISAIFDRFEQGRVYGRKEKAQELTKALQE